MKLIKALLITLFFSLNLTAQQRVTEINYYKVNYGETEESLNWKMEFKYNAERLTEIKTSSEHYPIFTPLSYDFKYEENKIIGTSKEGEINFTYASNNNNAVYILNKYFNIDLTLTYDEEDNIISIISSKSKGKEPYGEIWFYDYKDNQLSQIQYSGFGKKIPKRKNIQSSPVDIRYENNQIKEVKSVPRNYQFEYTVNEKTVIYDNSVKTIYSYQNDKIVEIKRFRNEDGVFNLKARTAYVYENRTGNENFFIDYFDGNVFLRTLQPTDGRIID